MNVEQQLGAFQACSFSKLCNNILNEFYNFYVFEALQQFAQ